MSSLGEKTISANFTWVQSVQTLIIGRLIVVFLLLVTTWVWYSGNLALSFERFPQGLILVFIIAVGLTIVYFFLLRISDKLIWQIWAQFLIDALLITWLVWRTGDITSPYIILYVVLISVSSIFLKPLSTLLMSFICVALFVLMAILIGSGIVESSGDIKSTARVVQIVSFHVVAFLVVGLLSARLSERRSSGEKLEETTRRLANLRLLHERIIESIRSGLITTDLDGTIYTFNAAAAEITGFSAEQVIGKPIESVFGDISRSIELSIAHKDESEPLPRFETDLTTPDNFIVHIGYNVTRLFSESNETTGLIITFQDLTEIRSMEENVRRKDRLAAVGRVAAGLAHEIRNPLGAMRGAIQVLESNTPKDSANSGLMQIILRESDRLNSIITNFLNYARPKAGDFKEIDLNESVRETLELLRHSPDISPNVEIGAELPNEPIKVMGDATQLKQIFWNLARNSMNAMPNGGKFSITVENIPNRRARLTFSDTGRGMPREQVERLFEPFSSSTTGGTGLGLSIVYQIVKDHNGVINVRSTPGEGTIITVDLPSPDPVNRKNFVEDAPDDTPRLEPYLNVNREESEISS